MKKNNYFNIFVVSGGMILGGVFNYLYHPVMLQFMTLEEFWIFGSLIGVLNLMGVIASGIILFLNKEFSENIHNKAKVKFIFLTMMKYFLIIWLTGSIVFSLMSPMIARYLQIENILYVILVGFTITLSLLAALIMAYIRWEKRFEYIGLYSMLLPFLKLIIWVILVFLGFEIYGALWGVVLSGVLGIIISLFYIQKSFKGIIPEWNTKELLGDFKKHKQNIIHFFLVSFFFALFMNIDVILAKSIFDETLAWAYAGISVLWKFLIFLMLSTETVYYGQIMEHKRETLPKHLIINPIVILSLISIWAISINIFIGEFMLWILKSELKEYYVIYILSLIYYSLLAYMSLFSKVLVWWKNYHWNIILWVWSIALILTSSLYWYQSLEYFILCFISIWAFSTLALGIIFYSEWKK